MDNYKIKLNKITLNKYLSIDIRLILNKNYYNFFFFFFSDLIN